MHMYTQLTISLNINTYTSQVKTVYMTWVLGELEIEIVLKQWKQTVALISHLFAGGSSCSTWCCRLPAGSKWATSCPVERLRRHGSTARIGMWNLICFCMSCVTLSHMAGCNLSLPDCRRCRVPQWRSLRLGSQGAAAGGGGIQKLATPGRMDGVCCEDVEVFIFWKPEWQNQPRDLWKIFNHLQFWSARARRQYWLANSSYKVHHFYLAYSI